MQCPRCHAENAAGMRFCGQCAAPLGQHTRPRFASYELLPKTFATDGLLAD